MTWRRASNPPDSPVRTNCAIEDVEIGMPVEAVFEDVNDEIALVKFRPRG